MNSDNPDICPACEVGQLTDTYKQSIFHYQGQVAELPLKCAVCSNCGEEVVLERHVSHNESVFVSARSEIELYIESILIRNSQDPYTNLTIREAVENYLASESGSVDKNVLESIAVVIIGRKLLQAFRDEKVSIDLIERLI
jgi:YgiT-type zinc finger domain-containing protein